MKIVVLILHFLLLGCVSAQIDNAYEMENVDSDLRQYLKKELPTSHPGLVCGQFKGDKKGCFRLIGQLSDGKAIELKYVDPDGTAGIIEKFPYPTNIVFLTLYNRKKIKSSKALPESKEYDLRDNQDAVSLHYFEKSTVVYYWDGKKFSSIWISD